MKFYLAPLEGITGFVYRNAYEKVYGDIDKYFTPFITPNNSKKFNTKELNDILPSHNEKINVVPQMLTNKADNFISTTNRLKQFGYKEVNLNLGCPSGTVVSKNRGSGFLSVPDELDRFLDKIFMMDDIKISIKTRIGKETPDEFYRIMEIYNKYPIYELIIHPRTQKDYYNNTPNMEMFKYAMNNSKNPICYNGDIFTVDDYNKLIKYNPSIDTVMLGRGIIANPNLVGQINNDQILDKNRLRSFHDEILENYLELFSGDKNTLFKMKEMWSYMRYIFSNNKKYAKRIKKAQNINQYKEAVNELFEDQEIIKGAGLFYEEN